MALSQKMKNELSSWAKVFPTEQLTQEQSLLFMKKLLAVAVSNITYLRALFPEYAYGDRALGGMQLKILKDDSCPKASMLIKWLKGCFDALEKQYLRKIIIGIFEKNSDPQYVIESYNFNFAYEDGISMTMNKDNDFLETLKVNTKKSTLVMLRTILILTTTLKPLPKDVKMLIKLQYYDDVTPPNYQPPGFVDCPNEIFEYENESVNIDVGEVQTPFNILKLRMKSDKTQFLSQQPENPTQTEVQTAPLEEIANEYETTSQEVKGIRCACNNSEINEFMLLCQICNYSQHAICFRILEETAAPECHVCHLCVKLNNPARQPTDPSLVSLSSLATQATCIWRRTLGLCFKVVYVNKKTLVNRLGVDQKVAQGLIERLKDEGFIRKKLSKSGHGVDKKLINSVGKPKYFELIDVKKTDDKKLADKENEIDIESLNDFWEPKDEVDTLSEKAKTLSVKERKTSISNEIGTRVEGVKGKKRRVFDRNNGQEFSIASSQDTTFYGGGNATPAKKWKTSRASPTLSV